MNFLDKYSHLPLAFAFTYLVIMLPIDVALVLAGCLFWYGKEFEGRQNTRDRTEYKGMSGRIRHIPKALLATIGRLDSIMALAGAIAAVVLYGYLQ